MRTYLTYAEARLYIEGGIQLYQKLNSKALTAGEICDLSNKYQEKYEKVRYKLYHFEHFKGILEKQTQKAFQKARAFVSASIVCDTLGYSSNDIIYPSDLLKVLPKVNFDKTFMLLDPLGYKEYLLTEKAR